jgi:signal transduction histidine kinase/CheY-like chemotaxis protein
MPGAFAFLAQPAPVRFGLAFAAVLLVFLVDSTFGSLIDDGSHFLLLGTAVVASAWIGGTGPALVATIAGALLGALDTPGRSEDARATGTHLALFIVQGLLLTALVSELRHARNAAEQEARDAQVARRESEAAGRMKDEFLATISHELRTPLNAVLGWLHLIRTGKLDHATSVRGLDAIERNVKLQARLTGDLLDVSKVLTGQLCLESRPISLTDAARQAISAATPAAKAKHVKVSRVIPDVPLAVLGDAIRVRQIVWHLLSNAIKFTPRGGEIRLALERSGDTAVLTVQDSGPGIDPAFLPRIFDRFTQQDPSPTRAAGGLGVGLSLVRDLVELHGGEIVAGNANSAQPGGGAVFVARFPLYTGDGQCRPAPGPVAVVPTPPLDGVRVLVFDKDADGRDLLRTLLEQSGALVLTAESVGEALEALEGWYPDVLVSDGVPDHDSYSVVGRVRSLDSDRGGRIPAAALTRFGRTDQRVRKMLEAFERDVPKPVEPGILTAEVASLAGRERRRMQRVQ